MSVCLGDGGTLRCSRATATMRESKCQPRGPVGGVLRLVLSRLRRAPRPMASFPRNHRCGKGQLRALDGT